ncbi:MAG: methyltransferase domain-containing protein [Oscillospiraceae bacterium]|nr:methyltransferase domain-containing protein [Oscillospiraceae bacterium]
MRSLFSCPLCGRAMEYDVHLYRCSNGHCFDISREGYVNLLPSNCRHSDTPGDDKEMVKARTRFLSGGWYEPLRKELCGLAERYLMDTGVLIDAGCGEGYYTETLSGVAARKGGIAGGIDLSKAAVRKAAKRCHGAEIAVASVYHMPLADQSGDLLIDCFAPLAAEEFCRVLKPEGTFLYVVPGRKHLWEMKEILYDRPYENDQKTEEYDGFHLMEEASLKYTYKLNCREDIMALFRMTPYAWKTPKVGMERLSEYRALDITAEFRVFAFQRDARQ